MVISFRTVAKLLGPAVLWFGLIAFIPAIYSIFSFASAFPAFSLCALAAMVIGFMFKRLGRNCQGTPSIRELFVFTVALWACTTLLASIPFMLIMDQMSFAQAVFESASGLSTTGATVIEHLDLKPRPILLWRSMLQFLGGIGFVVIAVAVFPSASMGGMNLFKTESSSFDGRSKITPHIKTMAAGFLIWYMVMLFLCTFFYLLGGFNFFLALNAALCTVSTGGMMPIDSSMNAAPPFIQYTAMVFMFLGSLPFMLILSSVSGNFLNLLRDQQVRGFVYLIMITSLMVAFSLIYADNYTLERALRTAFFNVIAIISSTGFNFEDFTEWNNFASILFFLMLAVGGCSGSTAGGLKIFRLQICYSLMKAQFLKVVHPHIVALPRYNGRVIDTDTLYAVITYLAAYILVTAASAAATTFFDLNIMDAISGTISCLSNIGPAVGLLLTPSTTYASFSDPLLLIFSFDMILGRLEILPVVLCMTRMFWKS